MNKKLCLLWLALSATLGCYHMAHLYPVQGPLSAQTPPPILAAKMTGTFTPANFSAVLNDGEVCKGRFSVIPQPPASNRANATSSASDLSSAWDSIYGPGFYVAHVLGVRFYARALASGNRGTILNVEIYRSANVEQGAELASIKGVAKDSAGNIYKMVF